MKTVPLTKGKFAMVDDEDFDEVSRHNWTFDPICDGKAKRKEGGKTILMHRQIMNCPDDLDIDHKNRDGLDNRKDNLRFCSQSMNMANTKKRSNARTSSYKGVCWYPKYNKWCAVLGFRKKRNFLGYFINEIEAAQAYDNKAREKFGEFARLNFPKENERGCLV